VAEKDAEEFVPDVADLIGLDAGAAPAQANGGFFDGVFENLLDAAGGADTVGAGVASLVNPLGGALIGGLQALGFEGVDFASDEPGSGGSGLTGVQRLAQNRAEELANQEALSAERDAREERARGDEAERKHLEARAKAAADAAAKDQSVLAPPAKGTFVDVGKIVTTPDNLLPFDGTAESAAAREGDVAVQAAAAQAQEAADRTGFASTIVTGTDLSGGDEGLGPLGAEGERERDLFEDDVLGAGTDLAGDVRGIGRQHVNRAGLVGL
jgi:hypothetical protein